MGESRYRALSLWWDQLPGEIVPRHPLEGDVDVDVAIVGAGFTGLWTARALMCADPELRVALCDAEVAGFGASGRNGGWCSAFFAASDSRIARESGPEAALSMRRAMYEAVDEVGASSAAEGIDCRFAKGGAIVAARNRAQMQRARDEVLRARELGIGDEDMRLLSKDDAEQIVAIDGMIGATYTPHCAALDPARLVRGLADAVERRGATLYERSAVTAVRGSGSAGRSRPRLETLGGSVRADVVVIATEAWNPTLPGRRRSLLPVYSLMIATEPLSEELWAGAGLASREVYADHRHLVIYGQRTADGRMAFGGRGAPYHFASALRPSFDRVPAIHRALETSLAELFPALAGARVTHRWGGPIGVPRDWFSSVGFDRTEGIAWAGGYVGDGVSTSNLAGRTIADLILGVDSELVRLPWVGHHSPKWEPEPLRWLGVNAALLATKLVDRSERRDANPSFVTSRLQRLFGH